MTGSPTFTHHIRIVLLCACLGAACPPALAAVADPHAPEHALLDEVEALHGEVLEFLLDASHLEEGMLFPASRQLVVFLSLANDADFVPARLELSLDGRVVATQQYDARDHERFARGGVQRVYADFVTTGRHEIRAVLSGRKAGQEARREARAHLDKRNAGHFAEVRLTDAGAKLQITQWQ